MSNALYPELPGLDVKTTWSPQFDTIARRTASGRSLTLAKRTYPVHKFKLKYNVLRSGAALAELQQIAGFFMARKGGFDDFLFNDKEFNTVVAQAFGTGNGTTTAWQLLRAIGVFVEPVGAVNGVPQVFRDAADWRGNELLTAGARTNLTTRSIEPANANWALGAATKGTAVAAPDGTTTAVPFLETATTALHATTAPSFSFVAGTRYVWSVYGKEVAGSLKRYLTVFLPATAFTAATVAIVDLATGAITGTSGTPFAVGVSTATFNGFWRVWVSKVATSSTSGTPIFYITNAAGTGAPSYLGDVASGLTLWGRQLEVDTSGVGAPSRLITTLAAAASETDYTYTTDGVVTFPVAPVAGALLTWTGNYLHRVKFAKDDLAFDRFMFELFELGMVELESFRP